MAKKKKKARGKRKKKQNPFSLPRIREQVAGVDLGSKEHWVCCPPNEDGSPNVRVFPAVTSGLKALDQMNVLVHRAVSDLTGKTGLSIVRSIVEGERDPRRLAQLRRAGCRKSEAEIAEYLTGTWRSEHLFNLEKALEIYDYLQQALESYDVKLLEEIRALQPPERRGEQLPPHPRPSKERAFKRTGADVLHQDLWRFAGVDLTRIDGIGVPAATVVLTEVGLDLSPFPTENHFVSWLRLSPRIGFSAGKPVKKTKNAMGATRVANALRMAAVSLQRSKCALGAYYRRIARRKGAAVAVFATARKLAVLIYRMLRYGQDYVDIGEAAFEARFQERRLQGITAAANQLGFQLVPIDQTA